ncbi:SpoIIAA family protein [Neolewinella persica]|uniref:STAS/SEC14 domain-containing protein n=1 Tax=Neolewinella persica TaxID=70998 RepID=UPI00036D5F40|nr:STAS/SEC14 domain-containing protein [Neolewinella persica]
MLNITTSTGKYLRYEVSGTLSRKDLLGYYRQLDQQYATAGKLQLLVVVRGFRGYAGLRSLGTMLWNEHKVFRKVARYAAVTDQRWFARLIRLLNAVVPTVEMKTFTLKEEVMAGAWLKRGSLEQ